MKKKNTGITLIALVITIIVLLILAGIVISLTIGENGMINKAKESGLAYDEQQAKEKLELVLLDIQADKVTNSEYNENEYLTKKIEENDMIVNEDIVFVNGWQFQIDRSVPEISVSLGKGQPNENIKLNVTATTSSDYVKSIIKVEIEYAGDIKYISIAGEEIPVPEKIDGKYTVEKEVTANGNYGILVKDTEDKYKIANVTVNDLTEDMNIYTKEDLEKFRDNVNSGRTYEGRTVKVMNDIDLQGSESNQWTPIGSYTDKTSDYAFYGTFDGQYHKISNLYIKTNNYSQIGMFIYNKGIIKCINLENCYIYNYYAKSNVPIAAGGITGSNTGRVERCYVSGDILAYGNNVATYVGGIAGHNNIVGVPNIVEECVNTANITSNTTYHSVAGGITAESWGGNVKNCINIGTINAKGSVGLIGGISGQFMRDETSNSYNVGIIQLNVSGEKRVGGVIGRNGAEARATGSLTNCYYLDTTATYLQYYYKGSSYQAQTTGKMSESEMKADAFVTTLGEAFTKDTDNINNGYPILKWQAEH